MPAAQAKNFERVEIEGYGAVPAWVAAFYREMEAVDRLGEWRETWDKLLEEYPGKKSPWQIGTLVAKTMGHEPWNEAHKRLTKEGYMEGKARQAERAFDAEVAKLPQTAEYGDELNWVATHPRISDARRAKSRAYVLLTAADVRDCAIPCPSQRAARMLQQYCPSPAEFWNKLEQFEKGRMRRAESVPRDEEVVEDVGLDEVKRLLKEVE
jgi:hypothetical protein